MNTDLERNVRDRLRRADLPAAPAELRTRLQAVVANPPDRRPTTDIGRYGRLLLPLAAVLVIGALAVAGGGALPTPGPSGSKGSTPPTGGPAPTPDSAPIVCSESAGSEFSCDEMTAAIVVALGPDQLPIEWIRLQTTCLLPYPPPASCGRLVEVRFAGSEPMRAWMLLIPGPTGLTAEAVDRARDVICDPLDNEEVVDCESAIVATSAALPPHHAAVAGMRYYDRCPAPQAGINVCVVDELTVVEVTYATDPVRTELYLVRIVDGTPTAELVPVVCALSGGPCGTWSPRS